MNITVQTLGKQEYAQLRSAALASVNAALSRYNAHRYSWMDDFQKDDIVSDAILKALKTFKEGAGCSFRTWVCRLAYQRTLDCLSGHISTVGISHEIEEGDEVEIPELTDCTTPEDDLCRSDAEVAVSRILEARSDLDRAIYDLYIQGYPPREIAGKVSISPKTISVRVTRIKKAVIKHFDGFSAA